MGVTTLQGLTGWPDRPCRNTKAELWFGRSSNVADHLRESPNEIVLRLRTAKAICAGCPIRVECLEEELAFGTDNQYGVRGGLTAKERVALLRGRRKAAGRSRGEVA
ncbi:WhiB family transcriptional regulator [Saccharothrix obliqua]|uniref:WhiB family transcriptional regulator n=1 Tax=Saccharothrix obliqua TaxID=2861747 RepID=UPI001C5FD684|nr:WhiB family transcriptional regulator [Saccharothrix obliqua]MBW4717413.1 WhiB family transcriptional regulator [Saccharothrix obliqua]